MDPVTGSILAVMTISSLAQAYNAERARGADKRKLKELQDTFDRIKPPNYTLPITAAPQYHEEALQQPQFSQALQNPQFLASRFTPEDFKVVGQYAPELAPYVAQAAPETVKQSREALGARDAQKKALERYMAMGETGDDAISAQAGAMAAQQAGMDARARSQAIMQDFQRRGQLGGGMQLASQLQGNAYASQQEAMARMQAASDAQRRRLEALASGASLGGQIYGQEMDLASRNANIINQFNREMANARQNWENQRAGTLNDAQLANLRNAQDIANRNVMGRNAAEQFNIGRADDITRYNTQFAQNQQARDDRLAQLKYENAAKERDVYNQTQLAKANWARQQNQDLNRILGQQFSDQMAHAQGRMGINQAQREANRMYTQDINQGIQGFGNVLATGGDYYRGSRNMSRQNVAADDRAQYERTGQWMSPEERQRRMGYYDEY